MSDLSIEQAIAEMRDLVRCRCHPAFTERKLHDPDCNCDSAEAVEVLVRALPAVQPGKPGKEVMPDVSDANSTHPSDTAPAGLSAGGGAGWLEQLRAETANVAVIVTGEGPHFEYWQALQFAYESGQLVAAGLSAGGGAELATKGGDA